MNDTGFLKIHTQNVLPEWIDYNGHMNVAFYVMVFDQSLDQLLEIIDFTREYREKSGCSVYVLETHVSYIQEAKLDDPLVISVRVIDCDEKRIHIFLEMRHEKDNALAATSEQMILHVDLAGPKAHPLPENILKNLQKLKADQEKYPSPAQLGSSIAIRRKKTA